jgi:pre-mRNA-processing factor 39
MWLAGCAAPRLQELDRYYKAVQLLAHTKPLEELLPPDAATQLRDALTAAKQQAAAAAGGAVKKEEPAAAAAAGGDDAPPGAEDTDMPDAPPGAEPGEAAAAPAADAGSAAAADGSTSLEVTDQEVKDAWLQQCTAVFEVTRDTVLVPRKPFEEKIKRPYYHFKPLDGTQLSNWVAYLDWVEAKGDVAAAIHLYERCLVPCANYPGVAGQLFLLCAAAVAPCALVLAVVLGAPRAAGEAASSTQPS